MIILFVDDDKRDMDSYVEELKLSGLDVVFYSKVDDALDFFHKNQGEVSLLILDIMMSPGEAFKDAMTRSGLRTGIRFYEMIRENHPLLPIILFTNMIENEEINSTLYNPNTIYLMKEDYLPYEFVVEVKNALKQV